MDAAFSVFEISWEVCNKVGGIYTVVRSKAGRMMENYQDSYFVVGPYFPKKAIGEFSEKPVPDFLREAFDSLRKEGLVCHYGTWMVEGEPNAILIDFAGFTARTNDIKRELWDLFKVDSLGTNYFDFDEPVVWAYSSGLLVERLSKGRRVIAHFHEWLSGAGLLYLKAKNADAATVFTTHATTIGRSMASADMDLYGLFGKVDPDREAYRLHCHPKHQTEKAAALQADVFTTVSEITGMEASHLLGRKPDVILPNGLNIDKFPTFDDASIKHSVFRWRLHEFIMYYFFPYYTFDLDNSLVYFLSGRYEFHDKGVDIFIRALANLNNRLKHDKSEKTVIAFFWIPGNIRAIKPELVEARTFYEDLKESIDYSSGHVRERLLYLFISQRKITDEEIIGKDVMLEIRRKVSRLYRKGNPPLSTHDLYDEGSDQIISSFRSLGLNNSREDRVKVVFYPIYLTGADRLLDLNYYEAMQGAHLGVFPSYYEPWGYTPLEAGALGTACVTTDLAGFGRYIAKESQKKKEQGIFVIPRLGKSEDEVVVSLSDVLYGYSQLSKEDRIKNKIGAHHLASHADWKNFIKYYLDAHKLAAQKKWGK